MKVKDLIAQLSQYSEDTEVVLRACERGYYDADNVIEVDLRLNVNDEWYYGPHELDVPDKRMYWNGKHPVDYYELRKSIVIN